MRRQLVPEMGGVAAELVGTVRLRLLQLRGPVCVCVWVGVGVCVCVGGWVGVGGGGWVCLDV